MSTPRTWLVAAVAAASLTLPTACGSDPPTPPPSTTPTATSDTEPSTTSPGLAPPVQNPLEIDEFTDNPCASLTAPQLGEFDLAPGKKEEPDNVGQASDNCTYLARKHPTSRLIVYVNYFPDVSNGLNFRYEEHEGGRWPSWQPTEVDGYPAVIFSPKDTTPEPSICDLDVGVSDSSFFNVRANYYGRVGYSGQDTCAMTKDIALAVLTNLEAAN